MISLAATHHERTRLHFRAVCVHTIRKKLSESTFTIISKWNATFQINLALKFSLEIFVTLYRFLLLIAGALTMSKNRQRSLHFNLLSLCVWTGRPFQKVVVLVRLVKAFMGLFTEGFQWI